MQKFCFKLLAEMVEERLAGIENDLALLLIVKDRQANPESQGDQCADCQQHPGRGGQRRGGMSSHLGNLTRKCYSQRSGL